MDTINFGEIDLTAISYYYSKTLVLHTRENWYKKYVEAVDHFAKGLFLAPTVAFFRPLELLQLCSDELQKPTVLPKVSRIFSEYHFTPRTSTNKFTALE